MELSEVILLYGDVAPDSYETKDTSHGENDFRQAVFVKWNDRTIVIKITSNDFTTPERIKHWDNIIDEYIAAGYYCPRIIKNRRGNISENINYCDKECVVYAEEYSKYTTAENFNKAILKPDNYNIYHNDAISSIGVIGSKHLTVADFPSGYCIMEKFSPSDPCDEVMETALEFKKIIDESLPQHQKRFCEIWDKFLNNKDKLSAIYDNLPSSVFQGDLNYSNILLDENLKFAGLLDFNLCGRDTVLNYLFREAMVDFDEDVSDNASEKVYYSSERNDRAVKSLLNNIAIVKDTYSFSAIEKNSAELIYRYLRPFWWAPLHELRNVQKDDYKVIKILDWIENELTRDDIDFIGAMS